METKTFDQWCILEVMGHQKFAGRVTEQAIAGSSFIRIDVPETTRHGPFSKLFGAGSIYALTPVEEAIARGVAESLGVAPLNVYELPEAMREKLRQPALTHIPDVADDEMDPDF